jgi:hypothetical protein
MCILPVLLLKQSYVVIVLLRLRTKNLCCEMLWYVEKIVQLICSKAVSSCINRIAHANLTASAVAMKHNYMPSFAFPVCFPLIYPNESYRILK